MCTYVKVNDSICKCLVQTEKDLGTQDKFCRMSIQGQKVNHPFIHLFIHSTLNIHLLNAVGNSNS